MLSDQRQGTVSSATCTIVSVLPALPWASMLCGISKLTQEMAHVWVCICIYLAWCSQSYSQILLKQQAHSCFRAAQFRCPCWSCSTGQDELRGSLPTSALLRFCTWSSSVSLFGFRWYNNRNPCLILFYKWDPFNKMGSTGMVITNFVCV